MSKRNCKILENFKLACKNFKKCSHLDNLGNAMRTRIAARLGGLLALPQKFLPQYFTKYLVYFFKMCSAGIEKIDRSCHFFKIRNVQFFSS